MIRLIPTSERGQALLEFALVTPLLLLLVFAMLDLGRVIWANDIVGNAAREGARFASVHGDSALTDTASKQDIRDHVAAWLIGAGTDAAVTVCYAQVHIAESSAGCSGNTDETGALNSRGALVTVGISTTVALVTGGFIGLSDFTVSTSTTMLVNN